VFVDHDDDVGGVLDQGPEVRLVLPLAQVTGEGRAFQRQRDL